MNTNKIGEFIKILRKEQNLTQRELADKLNITDRAVSKWERGLGCPDISLLEDLSKILNISISELLNGERIGDLTLTKADEITKNSLITYLKSEKKKLIKVLISMTPIFILVFVLSYLSINQIFRFENRSNFTVISSCYKATQILEKIKNNGYINSENIYEDFQNHYALRIFSYDCPTKQENNLTCQDLELEGYDFYQILNKLKEHNIILTSYDYKFNTFIGDGKESGENFYRGWMLSYEITLTKDDIEENYYLGLATSYGKVVYLAFERKNNNLCLSEDPIFKPIIEEIKQSNYYEN